MQEEIHHQNDQGEGDQKRYNDLLYALRDRERRVEGGDIFHILREALLHLSHQLADAGSGVDRVRARELVDGYDGGRFPIQPTCFGIVLGTKFDASDVADTDGSAHGRFAQDDLSELFRRHQTALRKNRAGKLLPLRCGRAAHLPSRVDGVLRLNGAYDLRDCNAKF